jgi:hypothetical protein
LYSSSLQWVDLLPLVPRRENASVEVVGGNAVSKKRFIVPKTNALMSGVLCWAIGSARTDRLGCSTRADGFCLAKASIARRAIEKE